MTDDPRLRLRLYVEGTLMDEVWIEDATRPAAEAEARAITERHLQLALDAEAHGLRWQVETWDPALPEGKQYFRMGTDTAGMGRPVAAESLRRVEAEIDRRYGMDPN